MPNPDPGLPLFYKNPQVLTAAAHAACGVAPTSGFAFAMTTNSVVIGAEEFFEAQAFYPIVFTASESVVAAAVLGLDAGRNLFVDTAGNWRAGAYIPAYVRRYPFVFIAAGENHLVLGIDEGATSFSRTGGEALFAGTEPTAMTRRALEFCAAFQVQDRIAREFAAALKANDLLVPQQANLSRGPGRPSGSLAGFTVVDEARFAALPDAVFLDWRRRNWLGLVYAHLLSLRRWTALAHLLEEAGD